MNGPCAAWLPDGRLHLQHGPIDLVIGVAARRPGMTGSGIDAYRGAMARFRTILPELVAELPVLRTRCPAGGLGLRGSVARRMEAAVRPFAPVFITPMAAVAGAVADEVLAAIRAAGEFGRVDVNNGGDIALHLAAGESTTIGLVADPRDGRLAGRFVVEGGSGVGGIATSGRHGRSFSLGIADAVTVIACDAAAADAAATMIANAVDLPGSRKVTRIPAATLAPDSDLGAMPVTVDVAPLDSGEIAAALDAGEAMAEAVVAGGLIRAVALVLSGEMRVVGTLGPVEDFTAPRLAAGRGSWESSSRVLAAGRQA